MPKMGGSGDPDVLYFFPPVIEKYLPVYCIKIRLAVADSFFGVSWIFLKDLTRKI